MTLRHFSAAIAALAISLSTLGANPPDDDVTCTQPCIGLANVESDGPGIDPGDGLMQIVVSTTISGTGSEDCSSTCVLCEAHFTLTYASYNPGQFGFSVQTPAGEVGINANNYSRPGILKAKCNPNLHPFFTAVVKDGSGVVQSESVSLSCGCN